MSKPRISIGQDEQGDPVITAEVTESINNAPLQTARTVRVTISASGVLVEFDGQEALQDEYDTAAYAFIGVPDEEDGRDTVVLAYPHTHGTDGSWALQVSLPDHPRERVTALIDEERTLLDVQRYHWTPDYPLETA